jgi:aspartyl-tRNA(Asn)/glutamyl-tRNA(Gln) amidotransferase subunit B
LKYEADRQYGEFQDKFGKDWQAQGKPKPFDRLNRVVDKIEERKNGEWKEVAKATRGWNDEAGETKEQRRKEEAADYRYFPEPDLVPVLVDADWQAQVCAGLGELPAAQRGRLQSQYSLSAYDAGVLAAQGRAFVAYFELLAKDCNDPIQAKNWLTNDVLQTLNERKQGIREFPIAAPALAELIREVKATGLNKQRAREVYAEMLAAGSSAKQAIAKLGIQPVADESQLLAIIRKAIEANPKAVADFKKGKVKAADAIKGAVMRETKGQAKAELLQQLLTQELQKA